MRIVHISDWHGSFVDLPEADVYACTGDMLPNFPLYDRSSKGFRISHSHEEATQALWAKRSTNQMRERLGSPDAPVVCVRGNHDFVPIASIFQGCDVTEFTGNELHEVLGKTVTGHRGIPWIHGTWSDETHRPDLIDRMRRMSRADVYLTHYPPWGVLDYSGWPGHGEEHFGLEELAYRLLSMADEGDELQSAHLFGHIHECGGMTRREGPLLFSNAATRFNVVDL